MSDAPMAGESTDREAVPEELRRPGKPVIALIILWDVVGALALLAVLLFINTNYDYQPLLAADADAWKAPGPVMADGEDSPDARKLERELKKIIPARTFIVIDRVHNRLWLRKDEEVLLDASISCGAGSILEDPSGKRKWIFDTPIGRFRVVNRRENPLWTAPDWEYIEANEPIPRRHSDRVQEGMLGEYALDLSVPGYMIHGTLYSRLLGRNVSHGCIRVGRDDLRVLWKKAPIGTPVFIF